MPFSVTAIHTQQTNLSGYCMLPVYCLCFDVVQTTRDAAEEPHFSNESADDAILNCCLQVVKKEHHVVRLHLQTLNFCIITIAVLVSTL